MAIPVGFVERLRERIVLSDIVGRWVKWDLRKSNTDKGDLWGPCPFHDDKTTSFHVDDRKGYFYCFGCHAKGDAITFMREKRGLGSVQAIRQLAFLYGMEVELTPKSENAETEDPLNLLQLKDLVVENFDQENFLEVGVLTGWTNQIRRHERLLRSLGSGPIDRLEALVPA